MTQLNHQCQHPQHRGERWPIPDTDMRHDTATPMCGACYSDFGVLPIDELWAAFGRSYHPDYLRPYVDAVRVQLQQYEDKVQMGAVALQNALQGDEDKQLTVDSLVADNAAQARIIAVLQRERDAFKLKCAQLEASKTLPMAINELQQIELDDLRVAYADLEAEYEKTKQNFSDFVSNANADEIDLKSELDTERAARKHYYKMLTDRGVL